MGLEVSGTGWAGLKLDGARGTQCGMRTDPPFPEAGEWGQKGERKI